MNAMPRFFVLSAIAGALIWLTGAPYPFPLLGKAILVASGAGFAMSSLYLHDFRPWQWRTKLARARRAWRTVAAR